MSEHLSALDASFLAAERPGIPLHIGGIARFEGAPLLDERGRVRIDDIRRVVEAHLSTIPRFRRRLQDTPLQATLPLWIDDEHFDIAAHVHAETVAAPGDEAALLESVMRIQAETLDRHRPLWDLTFLDGLADGSVVLVDRAHHALVDGVSGSEALVAMLDPDPDAGLPDAATWEPEPGPDALHQVTEALGALAHLPVSAARGWRDWPAPRVTSPRWCAPPPTRCAPNARPHAARSTPPSGPAGTTARCAVRSRGSSGWPTPTG